MTTEPLASNDPDDDKVIDELWDYIFELVDAIKDNKGHWAIADAKEQISMQLIELGNRAWMRGKQSVKENN